MDRASTLPPVPPPTPTHERLRLWLWFCREALHALPAILREVLWRAAG